MRFSHLLFSFFPGARWAGAPSPETSVGLAFAGISRSASTRSRGIGTHAIGVEVRLAVQLGLAAQGRLAQCKSDVWQCAVQASGQGAWYQVRWISSGLWVVLGQGASVGSTRDEAEARAGGRVWWGAHSDERCGSWDGAGMAGMASDGWLVTRGEGGWAARVQGEADLMWVCSSVD